MDKRMRRPHEKIGAMTRAPFSRPPNARVVFDWLGQQPIAQRLAVQASRLAELQRDLDACAPIQGLTVCGLDNGVLALTTPHAGTAAKFRQFERTLGQKLAMRGWRVERIRIRPQPSALHEPLPPPPPKAPVPAAALAAFEQLGHDSGSEALRAALARLVGNQRRRHGHD